jgi:DNA-binding response OmpR family regulator
MATLSEQVKAHVLVVEDHDSLRKSMVAALQRSGFSAVGIFCAEELMDAIFANRPDIYVIDIGLPGEDGMSLSRRIRDRQPQAGIVMLTAKTALNTRLEGYESGADVYLAKPVDPEELVALLASLARRVVKSGSEEGSELVLDPQTNQLLGPRSAVPLSEAEKRVLTRFALAPQSVLERWELMEALGSITVPVSPRSLEVRIATLRKKISDATGGNYNPILGIRGTGYKLRPTLKLK